MDSLDEFLGRLFDEGRVVLRDRPASAPSPDPRAVGRLERVFAAYRLEVAGPLIAFEPRVAVAAAELVRQACWALVDRSEPVEALARRLGMSRPPARPEDHLSADLTMRYLPVVHRRARALDAADALAGLLATVLRDWPLSGVLADLDDGPARPPDLGSHPGLMLLYAERLARHERSAWRPAAAAMPYVELALRDLGRGPPLLVAAGDDHA
jgi:hypothetical protein